ncbi:putative multiple sugar transport system permease protein [Oscillospiraceae bacterium]|nr:putative multiple sugar transport system permease protein [Oscillospiraceae bacterium]
MGSKVSGFLKKYMMLIALVAVVIFFNFATGGKALYPQNITNLIAQNAYVFVLATGMLLCILTGGNIDLAVGSVVCFAGGVGAIMMDKNIPWPVAVVTMLVMGLLIGMWQGFWIAFVKVPPFIATLAGMLAFRGLSNVVMGGFAYSVTDTTYLNVFGGGADCYIPDFLAGVGPATSLNKFCLVTGIVFAIAIVVYTIFNRSYLRKHDYKLQPLFTEILKTVIICAAIVWLFYKLSCYKGIPTAFIWIGFILGIFAYITTKTTLGRNLYAVGGNEKATRLSGINTKMVMFKAYTLMGLLAGFAGVLNTARFVGAQPTYGTGYEMDAIAACFIGGASAYGGTGSIGGVIIGALMMGVINQGMDIMGTSSNYKLIVKGLVLMFAVFFDVIMKVRRKGGAKA